jgi:RNA polymerase sigma-70 factor (ECF subfamily)
VGCDLGPSPWAAELASHEPSLRAAARHICRDDGDREDLIQDTFERALKHLSAGNPRPIHMRAWLVSILRNAFIDRKRRASIPVSELMDVPQEPPDPEPAWCSVSVDQVRVALDELPTELRTAFELHYLKRLRYSEIAVRLKIPPNTVATRLFRARRSLRDILLRQLEPGAKVPAEPGVAR